MKILRLALCVLLSVVVPIAAVASVMPVESCAMQMSAHATRVSAQDDMPDCCDHAGDQGHLCKSGSDCQVSCASIIQIPVATLSLPQIPLDGILVSSSVVSSLPHDPDGLWRPPQTL